MFKNNKSAKRMLNYFFMMISIALVFGALELIVQLIASSQITNYEYRPFPFVICAAIFLAISTYFLIKYLHFNNVTYTNVQTTTVKGIKVCDGALSYIVDVYVNGIKQEVVTNIAKGYTRFASYNSNSFVGNKVRVGRDPSNGKWIVL